MDLLGTLRGIIENLGLGSDVNAFLIVFGLGLSRIVMAVSLSPFLGGSAVAAPIKLGFSTLLTVLLMPELRASLSAADMGPTLFVVLLLKELAVGLTIGILSQLIFYAVQTAGALIDTARGMDQPGLTTPQLPSNASVLAQLKFQLALVIFMTVNGHLIYIRGLALSFEHLPLRAFAHFDSRPAVEQIAALSGQLLLVSLQLAAPVLIALFLVDVAFAALGKVSSRLNVHAESQPVKAWVGLAVLFLAIGIIAAQLPSVIGNFLSATYRLIEGLA